MAFNLATTPVQETVRYVSAYLDDVTGCSRALALQSQDPGAHERHSSLTLFHARSVPTIDLETYISRILKYFTVASKWFSDVFFTNSRYAKVGGLPVLELNTLELQFLSIIDYDLNVKPDILQTIGADLFCGRLPKLANVHTYHYDQAQNPNIYVQLPPNYTAAPQQPQPYQQNGHYHSQQQVMAAYNYQQQQQQQQYTRQQPRNNPASRSQRSFRHMSYPGPNGVYYTNTQASVYDSYPSAKHHMATKHVANPANDPNSYAAQHPSSGSTLASSSPGDTAAIATLNQGVV
ncbi:cyclin-like protein interacting with PHO85 [Dipsacomyces acuminosporus]|nr:cyclin-like protein interacting with PHO85 [Dipsacomyces acuminosporus]